MKFILNTAEFKNAVEKVLKLPSAENVKLSIKGKICCLCATNATQFITTQITAKSKANADMLLTDTKTLAKAMKYYTGEQIEFEYVGTTLSIVCGGKKANQSLIDVKTFPKIPAVGAKANNDFNYSNKKLKERFNTIKHAISENNTKPALTGVYFNGSDMVGVDGHRLAVNKDKALDIKSPFIVPLATVKLVNDVLSDSIQVKNDNKYIEFQDGNTTVVSRLIDGDYPKYGEIIGKKGKKVMSVDTKEFINSLNYLNTFQSSKSKSAACWSGDTVKNANGTADSKITVDNPAALDIEIGFNIDYMLEILSQFKDDVKIFIKNAVSPIIITYRKGDIVAALSPVRIKN